MEKDKLNKKETGNKIYQLIKEFNYSYEDIADYLNLKTPRVIYDWCNGIKLPCYENLHMLSKLFKVQIDDILIFQDVFIFALIVHCKF